MDVSDRKIRKSMPARFWCGKKSSPLPPFTNEKESKEKWEPKVRVIRVRERLLTGRPTSKKKPLLPKKQQDPLSPSGARRECSSSARPKRKSKRDSFTGSKNDFRATEVSMSMTKRNRWVIGCHVASDRTIAPYRRSATLQEFLIILVAKKQEIGQVRPVNGKYIRHKPQNRA